MAKTKSAYIDACCIIEALKKRRGIALSHPIAEVDMIERIMRAARDGEIELFTSMMTVAEVVHLGDKPPPADLKPLVERLILSGRDGITSVATTPQIVELARDLAIDEGLWDGVADRIHVASAITVGVSEILSLDGRLGRRLGQSTIRKCQIVSPSQTTILPDSYRANDLFKKV
jgi:predicted nucleic acid-binding protein